MTELTQFEAFLEKNSFHLVVFLTKHEQKKYAAYLAPADGDDQLSSILTWSSDSWKAVQHLCNYDWYPYAVGDSLLEAVTNLQTKVAPYLEDSDYTAILEYTTGRHISRIERVDQVAYFPCYGPSLRSAVYEQAIYAIAYS